MLIKHPFDVGDRVYIYGNSGNTSKGDDYFVKEISLLYTEFKKLEGHIVQAPNSYLNTLFILNQRRSGGLAEAVPLVVKFGTTLDQIDDLRQRLLEFVKLEKREYQSNILTVCVPYFKTSSPIHVKPYFMLNPTFDRSDLRLILLLSLKQLLTEVSIGNSRSCRSSFGESECYLLLQV